LPDTEPNTDLRYRCDITYLTPGCITLSRAKTAGSARPPIVRTQGALPARRSRRPWRSG